MKFSGPKILLHVEGLAVTIAACILYRELGASWTTFAIFFLVPDLSMLGYLFGKRTGARIYNSAHTYVAPFLLWSIVYFASRPSLVPLCLIWIVHIAVDRFLGYGLKYNTDFKHTHLQRM